MITTTMTATEITSFSTLETATTTTAASENDKFYGNVAADDAAVDVAFNQDDDKRVRSWNLWFRSEIKLAPLC